MYLKLIFFHVNGAIQIDVFIFVHQILGKLARHILAEPTDAAIVHLILVDQPSDTIVSRISSCEDEDVQPPKWNAILDGDVTLWYRRLFAFADSYLDNDDKIIVLMPCGLSYELHKLVIKSGFEVKAEWIYSQPKPLAHPTFSDMLVIHTFINLSWNNFYKYFESELIPNAINRCLSLCRHITLL